MNISSSAGVLNGAQSIIGKFKLPSPGSAGILACIFVFSRNAGRQDACAPRPLCAGRCFVKMPLKPGG